MCKRVKSQFIQLVRVQRVVPPVPGAYLSHTATLAREGRLRRMPASAPLDSDDKAPIDKIPSVSNDNVYANFERRKTCKGRRGVVFRDRPATGPVFPSRVVLSPETELKPNGDCVAIEARSGFLAALVGHFRRFKLRLTLDDLRSVVTTIVLVPVR